MALSRRLLGVAARGALRRSTSTQSSDGGGGWEDSRLLKVLGAVGVAGVGLALCSERVRVAQALRHTNMDLEELDELEEVAEARPKRALTAREKRFLRFASLESTGTIYMTPRDFLDSVTQEHPRQRVRRMEIAESEIQGFLRRTPGIRGNTKDLFRGLDKKGIVSFAEYLFLLSVLTKPRSGFDIAFNMFDMDGNHRVDKQEFLVIRALTTALRDSGKIFKFGDYLENEEEGDPAVLAAATNLEALQTHSEGDVLEAILSRGKEGSAGGLESADERSRRRKNADDLSIWDKPTSEAMKTPDTTILVHFFGSRGNKSLSYDDFSRFYDNLQTEVLELEFAEFSRGKATITESDFARILLRYTLVHIDDYQQYLQRLAERIPDEKGITFDQFQFFCKFLNNIDDFATAMKLFSYGDQPVSQAEFARAVKVSTGFALEDHVIETVFTIFDVNNDGELSYSEFIAVMKDRIHRGFRSHLVKQNYGWEAFKSCVREEMRTT